ncbi:MAG: phosphodiester glycosidase family protein [Deltaproteobacteria bacterium]|nr:phosphodiester glycosidase family protein [Deltaproteobacteria bacterium]
MHRLPLLLVLVLVARSAFAAPVVPGLDYEVLPGKFKGGPVHVLRVDLARLRIVQTDPSKVLQRSAAAFAKATSALAVANSNFYVDAAKGPPVGLLVGAGVVAQNAVRWYQPPTFTASLGFRRQDGLADAFDSLNLLHGPAPRCFTDVFTGSEWAVRGGVVPASSTSTDAGLFARHPRTVIGLSRDRRYAFVFVTQGRNVPVGAQGYTVVGAASVGHVALEYGAWDAVNLDGGGSSKLWVLALGGLKNSPTDGQERLVAYHLGVVAASTGAIPASCSDVPDGGATRDGGGLGDGGADGAAPDARGALDASGPADGLRGGDAEVQGRADGLHADEARGGRCSMSSSDDAGIDGLALLVGLGVLLVCRRLRPIRRPRRG